MLVVLVAPNPYVRLMAQVKLIEAQAQELPAPHPSVSQQPKDDGVPELDLRVSEWIARITLGADRHEALDQFGGRGAQVPIVVPMLCQPARPMLTDDPGHPRDVLCCLGRVL